MNDPKGEFVQKLIPAGAPVNFLLNDLAKENIATVQGDALDIPGRSKTLGGAEGELARAIELRYAEAGLQTPATSELIKTIPQRPKVIYVQPRPVYVPWNDDAIGTYQWIGTPLRPLLEQAGLLDDAVEVAKKKAGLMEARVVTYRRPGEYQNNIYSRMAAPTPNLANLANIDLLSMVRGGSPQFMYLWMP